MAQKRPKNRNNKFCFFCQLRFDRFDNPFDSAPILASNSAPNSTPNSALIGANVGTKFGADFGADFGVDFVADFGADVVADFGATSASRLFFRRGGGLGGQSPPRKLTWGGLEGEALPGNFLWSNTFFLVRCA